MQGIYCITNTANGKVYIGSSVFIERRWQAHQQALKRQRHCNRYLQNAWNKYGGEAFTFEIVEEVQETDALLSHEQACLDKIRASGGAVYNVGRWVDCSTRGVPLSEEHKDKIAIALKGHTVSLAACRKMSMAKRGKSLSKEHRHKISVAHQGRKVKLETRRKLSEAGKGNTNFQGHQHTPETRHKISKALKGRVFSEVHKNRISAAKAKPYPIFVHEETGELIPAGVNLQRMCLEKGLLRPSMSKVKRGVAKSHRGWRLAGING